ncbi:MAG: CPBP family intramembrane metalloprotease [Acetatifactor sp.]|nr:CPBP family intramembrane metalloprotease [Acetatifactor sp.]
MDRRRELKRLIVFLAFAFGITWVVFFAYIFSGNSWNAEGEITPMEQLVCLGMLGPAAAMLLTRYVTREGFAVTGDASMLLGISFRDKKWIYFVMAMFLPWIYYELGNGLLLLVNQGAFDIGNPSKLGISDAERGIVFMQPIAAIVSGTIVSFAAFGEEAGWRGYMMPKMVRLWGVKKAVLAGGIIWGMWHWPLTCIGHNFGRDYWGYPFTGLAAVCIMCITMGIILTYVTCRSGSVWPAVILHAVNNASPSIIQYYIDYDKMTGWRADAIGLFFTMMLPMIAVSLFMYRRLCKGLMPAGWQEK